MSTHEPFQGFVNIDSIINVQSQDICFSSIEVHMSSHAGKMSATLDASTPGVYNRPLGSIIDRLLSLM
jgi:hypothetical protein